MAKTQEELAEELCSFCELDDELKGVRNFGGEPSFCVDSNCCERAYLNYLDSLEDSE